MKSSMMRLTLSLLLIGSLVSYTVGQEQESQPTPQAQLLPQIEVDAEICLPAGSWTLGQSWSPSSLAEAFRFLAGTAPVCQTFDVEVIHGVEVGCAEACASKACAAKACKECKCDKSTSQQATATSKPCTGSKCCETKSCPAQAAAVAGYAPVAPPVGAHVPFWSVEVLPNPPVHSHPPVPCPTAGPCPHPCPVAKAPVPQVATQWHPAPSVTPEYMIFNPHAQQKQKNKKPKTPAEWQAKLKNLRVKAQHEVLRTQYEAKLELFKLQAQVELANQREKIREEMFAGHAEAMTEMMELHAANAKLEAQLELLAEYTDTVQDTAQEREELVFEYAAAKSTAERLAQKVKELEAVQAQNRELMAEVKKLKSEVSELRVARHNPYTNLPAKAESVKKR